MDVETEAHWGQVTHPRLYLKRMSSFPLLEPHGLPTGPQQGQRDVLFQRQGNNPGLPTPSPILVQRQRMLLLGMLRKGRALAETLGKPELEPWSLGVRQRPL